MDALPALAFVSGTDAAVVEQAEHGGSYLQTAELGELGFFLFGELGRRVVGALAVAGRPVAGVEPPQDFKEYMLGGAVGRGLFWRRRRVLAREYPWRDGADLFAV